MKTTKLSEKSTEELLKLKKILQVMLSMLGIALAILIVMAIYTKILTLAIVPVSILPILLINFYSLSGIQKELKSRNLKS